MGLGTWISAYRSNSKNSPRGLRGFQVLRCRPGVCGAVSVTETSITSPGCAGGRGTLDGLALEVAHSRIRLDDELRTAIVDYAATRMVGSDDAIAGLRA